MMTMFKKLALTAATVGSLAAATPSQAVITTFAAFNPMSAARNVRWVRSGTANGQLYTTATAGSNVAGSVNVRFSFLQNYFVNNNLFQNVTAKFTLNATTTNDPATLAGTQLTQQIDAGTFSFVTTTAGTFNGQAYGVGANLLSGVFSNAKLTGTQNGTSAGVEDSTAGGNTVAFTSDFLDFTPTVRRDFALALTAINPVLLRAAAGQSVRTFRASASGNFSSDPAPLINGIPEPATWGLMIAGFGMVGFQSRRRRGIKTVAA